MKKVFLFTLFALIISANTYAQTTCATAVIAEIGTNQAPAQSELWYKFSVSGKPLASYSVGYDSKSLNVRVEIFSGSCNDLTQVSALNMYGTIPAVENDAKTYYIHFAWNGAAPQAFEWQFFQNLVIPMTGINVTPKTYSPAFGSSFTINNVFTVNKVPSNATTSFFTEYSMLDCKGLFEVSPVSSDIWRDGNILFSPIPGQLSVVGSGTAKLKVVAVNNNDATQTWKDTVTINVAAPALCSSATPISAGTNHATAVQEQWFRFTPSKTGIHAVNFEDIDINGDGKGNIVTNWTVYKGECGGLRKVETTYPGIGFQAEAGQVYSIKLNQSNYYGYGLSAFNWTLAEPKALTGFSLTNKTLELVLKKEQSTGYVLYELGINFTPEDTSDKGVSVTVRDTSLIDYWDDGQDIIYKDIIYTKGKEGSTYIVFTTRDGGFKDSCLVTVKNVHLTSFALSLHEKTLWLPYSSSGEYVNVNDTSALRIICAPENATDKSYSVTVRKKGIVTCYSDGRWYSSLTAQREGSTWVVFTANDGGLQDSVLINVTRTTSGGSPCNNATVAQLGNDNNMPAAEWHTEWFTFTPTESANYGMSIIVEKYPFTDVEVYTGNCNELYLIADGELHSAHYDEICEVGFYGESGKTYYLKLTTRDFNTMGGGVIIPYKWLIKKVSASISGKVTDNSGAAVQGKVELYSVKTGKTALVQTTDIQAGGTYGFVNLTVGNYAVRAVTTGGDMAWYGINAPYFTDNWRETFIANTETDIDITVTPQTPLSEGTAKISGYIVKSEDVTPQTAPSIRRVKLAEGNPAVGITVFLQRNNDVIAYTQTNSAGYFEFSGVGAGDYQVVVQIVGIESEATGVTITEDGQTVELAYEVSETAIENTTTAIEELKIENEELKILIDNEQLIINNYRGGQVSVFDIAGRRLISQNSQLQIYIGGLPQGIYLVKAGNKTAKFIKR